MISVIIPAYNCEKTIEKCVNSLLQQTYDDYEIIVVNDGSTDSTEKIVIGLQNDNKKIRLISQKNGRVSNARNTGIKESHGDFITFVDSDDYVDKDYLQSMIDIYIDDSIPAINFVHNDDTNPILTKENHKSYKINENLTYDYFIGVLKKSIGFTVWNKLFLKKKIIDNNIFFKENINVGEDMIFLFEYLKNCKEIIYNEKAPYHYYIHESSAMNSLNKNYLYEYESTFSELLKLSIEDKVLNALAFEMIIYIFSSKYVWKLNYKKFKKYFQEIKETEVYTFSLKTSLQEDKLRKVFLNKLRNDKILSLYLMVLLNKMRIKIKRMKK